MQYSVYSNYVSFLSGVLQRLPKHMLINCKSQTARRNILRHSRVGTFPSRKMASTCLRSLSSRERWDLERTTERIITELIVICAEKHRTCLRHFFQDSSNTFLNIDRPGSWLQVKVWRACRTVDLYNDEVNAILNLLHVAENDLQCWDEFLQGLTLPDTKKDRKQDRENDSHGAKKTALSLRGFKLDCVSIGNSIPSINAAMSVASIANSDLET
jgi:hypothetical protein